MVLNATISNISVILLFGQFYWWRKLENLQKITDIQMYRLKLSCTIMPKKNICVSDQPNDPKILPPTLTFFMLKKKVIDRQNPEIHLRFRLQQ